MAAQKGERKWKCIGECEKEFAFGDWECFSGVNHKVEEKSYYIDDAPYHDPKLDPEGLALRASRNQMYVLPPKRVVDEVGTRFVERGPIFWVMGRYTTSDPEVQFFIERNAPLVSYERWFERYHTETQKQRIKGNSIDQKLKALEDAKATENELLERIKKLKEEAAAIEKKKEKATA